MKLCIKLVYLLLLFPVLSLDICKTSGLLKKSQNKALKIISLTFYTGFTSKLLQMIQAGLLLHVISFIPKGAVRPTKSEQKQGNV